MANINSKSEARKKVRGAQARANEARLEYERQNIDDAASFLVELGRLAAVDECEQNRIIEIHAEGQRRRHEHRQVGAAAAVSRMQARGETLAAIAELAGVKVSDVRMVLKSSERTTGRGAGYTRRGGLGECRAARRWVGRGGGAARTRCRWDCLA